ncbi:MAG: hypothetical protein ACFB22_03145 [Rhodothalassiaceae bacterium]
MRTAAWLPAAVLLLGGCASTPTPLREPANAMAAAAPGPDQIDQMADRLTQSVLRTAPLAWDDGRLCITAAHRQDRTGPALADRLRQALHRAGQRNAPCRYAVQAELVRRPGGVSEQALYRLRYHVRLPNGQTLGYWSETTRH